MRHELHLARVGFVALVPVIVVTAAAGLLVAGAGGARSAAIGVGIVAANHAVAALSTSWARVVTPGVVAVGYAMFVVRMAFVLGVFGTLQTVSWVHDTVLAVSFCLALVVSLTAECLGYVRRSYVPAWRVR